MSSRLIDAVQAGAEFVASATARPRTDRSFRRRLGPGLVAHDRQPGALASKIGFPDFDEPIF